MRSLSRHPAFLFAISALLIVAGCLAVLRSQASPDLAAWGVTFDLTISIPLLYWFFVVRSGKGGALTIVPVFLVGTIIATRVIPAEQQQFIRDLGRFVVPIAKVLLIVALIQRLRTKDSVVTNAIRSEVAMIDFALFGWKRQPEPRDRAVTFHERNGWGTIVICIYVLIAAEGFAMHLLLAQWGPIAAWSWTALDLWAALWLLGDYQGLRLHRSYVDDDALHIHYGLRWTMTIPRELIASVEEIRNENEWKRKDVLKLAILDEPRWLIALREPVIARGMAGLRKEIRALAILPDQDDWIKNLQ